METLQDIIDAQGLTQAELAGMLDVKRQTVHGWVRGREDLPKRRAAQISLLIGVPMTRILDASRGRQ